MTEPSADALTLAGLVRAREVAPTDLVKQAVERIEAANPTLNAVIHRRFDAALAEAEGIGASGAGPLAGVPMLVKDAVCHTAGDPFHAGMRLLRDRGWTESEDSYLAARFRAAGLVIVGKTNTPELATAYTTEPVAYGPTRNPYDLTRSAGGSSGGSAAAVAAGMVAVAHGNDMGGSIRVPASMCGLVGLKPTRARTSLGPALGEYWAMLTHEGVLTRTVAETAAVLDAVAGPMPGDPYWAPPPERPYATEVTTPPGRLRIGLLTAVPGGRRDTHPECVAAVERTGALLESLGHQVELSAPDALADTSADASFGLVFAVSVARDLDRWSARLGQPIGPDDVEPRNWMLAELGRPVSAPAYVEAVERLQGWARRIAYWWTDHDVLVTPTVPEPPPLLGRLPYRPTAEQVGDLGQFAAPYNVTGQPAISLPLHHTAEGLPVGVQLVAGYGREDVLFRLSAQLERATAWPDHRPPVAVFGA